MKIKKYNPLNLDLKLNTENIKDFIRKHVEKLGKVYYMAWRENTLLAK